VKTANAVWVTDVTCGWTDEGWLFLAVMLDLFARRVVGWAASDTNDSELALAALGNALRERNPGPGLVHHSDRGSPYASGDYRRALEARGIVASMSRKGDCWDNAVAESFFATGVAPVSWTMLPLRGERSPRCRRATRRTRRSSGSG
jgi:transposase InsO family protein